MAVSLKTQVKKEYNLYKGVAELIKAMDEKGMLVEPAVKNQMVQILENKKRLDTFLNEGKGKSDLELREKWFEMKAASKVEISKEDRDKINAFFANMSEDIAKTNACKNLYGLYLGNCVSVKSPETEQIEKEKSLLEGRLRAVAAEHPNIKLKDLGDQWSKAIKEKDRLKKELEKYPGMAEIKKLNAQYAEIKKKSYFGNRQYFNIDRTRENMVKQQSLVAQLKENIQKMAPSINKLKQKTEGIEVHKGKLAARTAHTKKLAELMGAAYEKAKGNEKLKDYAALAKDYAEKRAVYNDFEAFLNKIDPTNTYRQQPIYEFLEEHPGLKKSLDADKDLIQRMKSHFGFSVENDDEIMDMFQQEMQNKIKALEEELNLAKENVKDLEDYKNIFQTEEIEKTRTEEKELDAWLKDNTNLSNWKTGTVGEKKERDESIDKMKGLWDEFMWLANNDKGVPNGILNKNGTLTAENMIEKLNEYEGKLVSRGKELDGLEKEYNRIQEEKRKISAKIPGYDKYEAAVEKTDSFLRTENKLAEIKKDITKLSEKFEQKIFEADVKRQAKLLLEQEGMRKDNHVNSKEYDDMVAALQILGNWGEPEKDQKTQMAEVRFSEEKRPKDLQGAMKLLSDTTGKYLKEKNAQFRPFPSARRQDRMTFANLVNDLAKGNLETNELSLQDKAATKLIENVRSVAQEKNMELIKQTLDISM